MVSLWISRVLFVRHMENTRAGSRGQSKDLLEKLFLNTITVSWMGSTSSERSFDTKSFEYGSRNYFLGLSSVTGGFFQPCRETASLFDIFTNSSRYNDPNSELRLFLDRVSFRYRIKFSPDPKQMRPKKVSITFRDRKFQKNALLDFPKLIY